MYVPTRAKQRKISSQANKQHQQHQQQPAAAAMIKKKERKKEIKTHTALHYIYTSTDNHWTRQFLYSWMVRFYHIYIFLTFCYPHEYRPQWRSKLAHMTGYMFSFDLHIQYNRTWMEYGILFNMLKWVWHCFSFHFQFSLENYECYICWKKLCKRKCTARSTISNIDPLFGAMLPIGFAVCYLLFCCCAFFLVLFVSICYLRCRERICMWICKT